MSSSVCKIWPCGPGSLNDHSYGKVCPGQRCTFQATHLPTMCSYYMPTKEFVPFDTHKGQIGYTAGGVPWMAISMFHTNHGMLCAAWEQYLAKETTKITHVSYYDSSYIAKPMAGADRAQVAMPREMGRMIPKQQEYLNVHYKDTGFVKHESRLDGDNPLQNVSDRIWLELLKKDNNYIWTDADKEVWKENCDFGPHNAAKELDALAFDKYKLDFDKSSSDVVSLTEKQYKYLEKNYADKGFVADKQRIHNNNPVINIANRNWQEVLRKDKGYAWDWRKDSDDMKSYGINSENAAHGLKNAVKIDSYTLGKPAIEPFVCGIHNNFGRVCNAGDARPEIRPGNDWEAYRDANPVLFPSREPDISNIKISH